MFGIEHTVPDNLLLACILDDLEILKWQRSRDGMKGRNVPEKISSWMLGRDANKTNETQDAMKFRTGAEFEAERNRIMRTIHNG